MDSFQMKWSGRMDSSFSPWKLVMTEPNSDNATTGAAPSFWVILGWDCFQLLQNGSWDKAGADDKYTICGPDTGGHDRSWQIGKVESEEATPGSHFVVCVSLDDKGKVSRVSWEKL
eukprot:g3296.t1